MMKEEHMKAFGHCFMGTTLLLLVLMYGNAFAISLDDEGTLEITGKIQSRISLRMSDSEGYTSPDTPVGHMVQQRNLAQIELNQLLLRQSQDTPEVKYHIKGRFLYEGVYDYGPDEYQETRENNPDVIDEFKKDEDLWECYLDYSKGPWFFRVGKQNLSWGETDVYQLMDRINPIDNTFGGAFEDLDDRRIPLWMMRGTYNFGNVGPVSSFTAEGFINPGWSGQEVAPLSPYGTPYAYPSSASSVLVRVHEPEETFQNSRMGIRLQGVLADNFNVSIAHYQTICDTPSAILTFDPTLTGYVAQDLTYETEQVTGATASFYESHIDAIVRAEAAWFWDEPVFIPEVNLPALFGVYETGKIPTTNMLRYMVGLDKSLWMRFINDTSMINCYFQYFAEYYPDYDDRQCLAVEDYSTGGFIEQKRYEQKVTLITSTTYMSGTLTPQIVFACDPRGAMMYIPSIEKSFHPWIFKIAYYGIVGDEDVSVGILKDRQQLSMQATVVF